MLAFTVKLCIVRLTIPNDGLRFLRFGPEQSTVEL